MKRKALKTFYGVFIIESLRDDDHKDGEKLKQILDDYSGKPDPPIPVID